MKIDIPTKKMVQRMVQLSLMKEMNNVYRTLDKFRKRIIKLEEKTKNIKLKLPEKNQN